MWDEAHLVAQKAIKDAVSYNQQRWDKHHKESAFQLGDQVLVSTYNFANLSGPKKLQDSWVGPFMIKKMHGPNAAELILTGDMLRKHPTFPVSLLKPWKDPELEKFPLRKNEPIEPPVIPEPVSAITKILKHKLVKIAGKDTRLYLVRFKGKSSDEDKWLKESDIPDSDKILRNYRASKR